MSYFNHEIHVNKGIGCASCHGRVDQMPLMYAQNTLQMEWCLDCHRNPAKNLRPTSEIYNMAWEEPGEDQAGVVRGCGRQDGRADGAKRELHDEGSGGAAAEVASLQLPGAGAKGLSGDVAAATMPAMRRPVQEVHQPGRAGPLPAGSLQDSHPEGPDQLRGVPPMSGVQEDEKNGDDASGQEFLRG